MITTRPWFVMQRRGARSRAAQRACPERGPSGWWRSCVGLAAPMSGHRTVSPAAPPAAHGSCRKPWSPSRVVQRRAAGARVDECAYLDRVPPRGSIATSRSGLSPVATVSACRTGVSGRRTSPRRRRSRPWPASLAMQRRAPGARIDGGARLDRVSPQTDRTTRSSRAGLATIVSANRTPSSGGRTHDRRSRRRSRSSQPRALRAP